MFLRQITTVLGNLRAVMLIVVGILRFMVGIGVSRVLLDLWT